MKAATYVSAGNLQLIDQPKPAFKKPTDAIASLVKTTICGTDLHILGGDVPACKEGTILGHLINGTQAEYVHIPHADGSLYHTPASVDDEALVMLSDILPTSYEIGVLPSHVKPGDNVCIVGAGPIGLAALLTVQFFSPATIIMVDLSESRLEASKKFGATHTICSSDIAEIKAFINEVTDGRGVDISMECVGYPATFDVCQNIISVGGHIANVGVHGKPVSFNFDDLWIKNITLNTGLVNANTTEMLLNVLKSGKIDATKLVTHHFKLSEAEKAYEIFKHAGENNALKVIIDNDISQ